MVREIPPVPKSRSWRWRRGSAVEWNREVCGRHVPMRRIANGTASGAVVVDENERRSRGFAMVTERKGVTDGWVKIATGDMLRKAFHRGTRGSDIMVVLTWTCLATAGAAGACVELDDAEAVCLDRTAGDLEEARTRAEAARGIEDRAPERGGHSAVVVTAAIVCIEMKC
jgi:hypothetical protein